MSKAKKQHYVPRFYLRYFSKNLNGTHIGLFNKRTGKLIPKADLKNQSYEKFFYGENQELEDSLSDIEDRTSKILNGIISTNTIPKATLQDHQTLRVFTFLQEARTKRQANILNTRMNASLKVVMKLDKRFKDRIETIEFQYKEPASVNIAMLLKKFFIVDDLECKMIHNLTDIPFLTSDDPVVRYNQFMERRNYPGGPGLASKGLQVFYPISPALCLLFYDKKVYKVGDRKKFTIETKDVNDIHQLNLLQMMDCNEHVYFNEAMKDLDIENLYQSSLKYPGQEGFQVNEEPERERSNGEVSKLLHVQITSPLIKLKLSFIRETDHAKNYVFTGYVVELRDERLRPLIGKKERPFQITHP